MAKIQRSYQVWGLLEKVTSRGTGSPGTIRNEVKLEYDHYGQLKTDLQEHNGAVGGSTKKVGYTYESGAGNTVRRTGMVYLDGTTTLGYVYASGTPDAMSRVSSVSQGGSTLAGYRYLGLETVVGVKYDSASNTELTLGITAYVAFRFSGSCTWCIDVKGRALGPWTLRDCIDDVVNAIEDAWKKVNNLHWFFGQGGRFEQRYRIRNADPRYCNE